MLITSVLLSDFNSWQMRPDVRLHVRQLIGQDVADHLHRHPIARHLLPHSQSPAGGDRALRSMLKLFSFYFGSAVKLRLFVSLLEQFDVAHDELLPVDEDHGHLLLRQQLAVQQRLVEDLNTQAQDSVTQHTHDHIFKLFVINISNYLFSNILLCL